MSNYYDDSFIFGIDNNNQTHLIAHCSSASLGCSYRDEVFINNKVYSVFFGVDDDEMSTQTTGDFLPYLALIDCRSFFSGHPTALMQQAIRAADLEQTNIVKLVWMRFESNSWRITSSTGWLITADSEHSIDSGVFDNAVSKNNALELVADDVVRYVA